MSVLKVRMGRYRATWANSGGLREVREPVNKLPTGNRQDSSSLVRIGFLPPSGNRIPAVAHEWAAAKATRPVAQFVPVRLTGRLTGEQKSRVAFSKLRGKADRAAMHECRNSPVRRKA